MNAVLRFLRASALAVLAMVALVLLAAAIAVVAVVGVGAVGFYLAALPFRAERLKPGYLKRGGEFFALWRRALAERRAGRMPARPGEPAPQSEKPDVPMPAVPPPSSRVH